ncbi:hypothetical protein ACS0TY_022703 [Phlomoides rotata]
MDAGNGDHFIIDDLLNFPTDETPDGALGAAITGTAADTSCNSSAAAEQHFNPSKFAPDGGHFSGELWVPYDDFAELDWLSIEEEQFCSEDFQKLQLIQGMKARTDEASQTHLYQFQPEITQSGTLLRPEMSVPGKARSKRSRAAPGNWTSRLLMVSETLPSAAIMSAESDVTATMKKAVKPSATALSPTGGEGRRCLHCASDKTPQWRTGPMGPKTLCNACGVRYKSGRLVPEYRPASSPTFVLTKHSNSHRKVMELRRQKEMQKAQQQPIFLHHHHHHHQNMILDVSNGEDYLIHQHIGPDYRQLI